MFVSFFALPLRQKAVIACLIFKAVFRDRLRGGEIHNPLWFVGKPRPVITSFFRMGFFYFHELMDEKWPSFIGPKAI